MRLRKCKNKQVYNTALGLAEKKLIFPTAALTVLSFVSVARKVWLTHQMFRLLLSSARTTSKLSLQHFPLISKLAVGKILGGDIARMADPN